MKREASTDGEDIKRRNGLVIIAGLVAIGVVFSSSLAIADNNARPFSANFIGTRAIGSITFSGTGIATHLGTFDLNGYRVIDGQPTPSNPCVGFQFIIVTLTAADGDELWLDATGGELCFDLSNFPLSVPFLAEADFVGIGGITGELWGVVGY
jgi:hypothetical protein